MTRKPIKKEIRLKVWKKYHNRCAYCGCLLEYKDMQVDHIIPFRNHSEIHGCLIGEFGKVNYGIDNFKNLNPACRVCNKWKTAMVLEEFRNEISMQVSRLTKRSAGFRMALKYGLIESTVKKVEFYFEQLHKGACPECGKIWEACSMCRSGDDHQSCVIDDMCHECRMDKCHAKNKEK